MISDIQKFWEMMQTDKQVQEKLRAASEAYTGEQTEEAIFEGVLVPVAKEYGISATFEEYKAFLDQLFKSQSQGKSQLSEQELEQVAGGSGKETNYGVGAVACYGFGVGLGNPTGLCVGIGVSDGRQGACMGKGTVYNAKYGE